MGLGLLSSTGCKYKRLPRSPHATDIGSTQPRFQGGTLPETTAEEQEIARRYHRFYLALQLRDLCNEVPIHRVALKYDVPRGSVQSLAQTCQGFAAGMVKFCEVMGWG